MNTESAQPLDDTQRRRLFSHVTIVSWLAIAGCLLVAAAVVWAWPQIWLWPAATGGTARHWIVGAVVVMLCGAVGITIEELLRLQYARAAHDWDGLSTAPLRRFVYLALLSSVLVWPLWDEAVRVWQTNDSFLIRPVLIELSIRSIPPVALVLIAWAAEQWVTSLRRRLTYTDPQPGLPHPTPATNGNGVAVGHTATDLPPVPTQQP